MSTSIPTARELIEKLRLRRHEIEDGHFSDLTYSSSRKIPLIRDGQTREAPLADSVYFLYEKGQFSPWHRMRTSDETWIHQLGAAVIFYLIDENDCQLRIERLNPFGVFTIPAGHWFAAEIDGTTGDYCLSTLFLCPAFNMTDFQLGDPDLVKCLLKTEADWEKAKKFFHSQGHIK